MRRLGVLLIVLLVVSGCRKKTAPEYYQLESSHSVMVARDGDEAYLSDEMSDVLAGLKRVDPAAIEGPKAAELAGKIEAERQRVERAAAEARAELEAAVRPAPFRPDPSALRVEAEPEVAVVTPDAGAVDAGREKPFAGMPLAEFQKAYPDCFALVPPPDPNPTGGVVMQLRDTPACRTEFNSRDPAVRFSYVFVKGLLTGERTERRTTQMLPPPPAPPAPPAARPDAGEYLLIPGAPLPDELRGKIPPSSPAQ